MVTFKEFFSFKNNRFFWLNLIAMIVVLLAVSTGTLFWLDHYTHHGESYVVPNVKDKTFTQAEEILSKNHMKAVIVDSSYVKGMPANIILDQTPAGGMRVKEGRTIYLTINTDKVPLVKIPDIIDNTSARQAEAKLKAMGFHLTEPEYVSGEQEWVYGIKYRGRSLSAGDKVPHESLLTLCIGNSPMGDSFADSISNANTKNIPQTGSQGNDDNSAPKVDDSWF
ncbi:PASTA domain-containing protein [uncultured Bacteroides sp.]|uniref:PASTA domain-containing protein n=1 Tax=uncultured Bacteroides sp. TaxID=162156 RepID=UPI002614DBD5|nr:PASTA domain-containing protein [uncultured Bacteroides sp.]